MYVCMQGEDIPIEIRAAKNARVTVIKFASAGSKSSVGLAQQQALQDVGMVSAYFAQVKHCDTSLACKRFAI